MVDNTLATKVLTALGLLCLLQLYLYWKNFTNFSDEKMSLEDEVITLTLKRDNLKRNIMDLEREKHRLELKIDGMDIRISDLVPLTKQRRNLPIIFFITPTIRRPAQKADLIRLSQTLSRVPNLYWILVEDAEERSHFIDEILARTKLRSVHLTAQTPVNKRLNFTDPTWKLPKGVVQRNAALRWIRTNFATVRKGVVYFGDDDNVYDWKLFEEMRTIVKAGVWPVGLVGGLLSETPLLFDNLTIRGFNSVWKPKRPFPIDMAAFAINLTIVNESKMVEFTYHVPRGFQESHFLQSMNLSVTDLEPKAEFCSKVYVWHTRTERSKLTSVQFNKFTTREGLTDFESDAIE